MSAFAALCCPACRRVCCCSCRLWATGCGDGSLRAVVSWLGAECGGDWVAWYVPRALIHSSFSHMSVYVVEKVRRRLQAGGCVVIMSGSPICRERHKKTLQCDKIKRWVRHNI